MVDLAEVENPEFKWGKKRGIGGKKKDVRFYESFTYDDVEYALYDSVYLYKEDEPEPYIGKLIKIWEHSDKTKKVKILWFFRPCEIANFLGNRQTLDNELFLACGEGVGLTNINPLEAIAGKCNVVCISKDSRNPQPSDEELQMSDFVFYRTFDVGHREILEKVDEKVAGIEARFIFNRVDHKESSVFAKLDDGVNSADDVHEGHRTAKPEDNFIDTSVKENVKALLADQKSILEKQPTSVINVESGERAKTNDPQENISSDKATVRSEVKKNACPKVLIVNHRSSSGGTLHSGKGLDFNEVSNTTERLEKVLSDKSSLKSNVKENSYSEALRIGQKSSVREKVASRVAGDRQEKVCNDSTTSSSKVNSEKRERKGGQVSFSKFKVKEDLKSIKDPSELDDRPYKRVKLDGSAKVYDDRNKNSVLGCDSYRNSANEIALDSTIEDKSKLKLALAKESHGMEKDSSKRAKDKVDKNPVKLFHGKFSEDSASQASNIDKKIDNQVLDVTKQPSSDRSEWFRDLPWVEKMQGAHEQGKLVLFENLDPSWTSTEVEDIISCAFKVNCSAKMMQQNAFSSPHSGQAYAIFKTREAAEKVITKLDDGCLLLSNGRPLIGSIRAPCFTKKQPTFCGHIVIEKLKFQMQREMKEAQSTSHCAQPNSLEYDMAIEWCLQQERSDRALKLLYRRQGDDLRRLKSKLKCKLNPK